MPTAHSREVEKEAKYVKKKTERFIEYTSNTVLEDSTIGRLTGER